MYLAPCNIRRLVIKLYTMHCIVIKTHDNVETGWQRFWTVCGVYRWGAMSVSGLYAARGKQTIMWKWEGMEGFVYSLSLSVSVLTNGRQLRRLSVCLPASLSLSHTHTHTHIINYVHMQSLHSLLYFSVSFCTDSKQILT